MDAVWMTNMGDPEVARQFIEALVGGTAVPGRTTFDATALQGLTVVEAAEGRVICELPVTARVQNRYGTLHGGCTATLVDTVSTAALLTASPHTGVSVNLAINYVAPMPGSGPEEGQGPGSEAGTEAGEVVVVDARVTRVGRQLATLAVELRRKATGQVVATGTHTKFLQVPDPATARMRLAGGKEPPTRSKL
ncbi:Acyl-coenzyme A thioesterase 13 [Tetrabaena socialis]|uniref:Acyl-coenzyme A thioesterase 13 n=1 Tax=Tetrabaena socialis TaxID=47790 RepID=A0A2J8A970_9CHLO|nr:Acyl-coenzyme A thioesterase 13 [Tetrabaena socialis]|eukprot:PNH09078.1 Acyl-coenzyme A thioesterase 13 [Tetrabaena socialis]